MKTRVFLCSIEGCNKSFRNEESLNSHLRMHDSQSKYDSSKNCKICGKIFTTRQSMKEHSYTHSDKKMFRCPEGGCGKTFRQSTQLCNHRKMHKGMKEMIRKQLIEVQSTQEFLQELSSKLLDSKFPDSSGNLLPAIKGPEPDVKLPSLDFI